MCRHLAYVGPSIPLDTVLFDAPHALVRQAIAPRLQTATPDNPDGWGVAWYDAAGDFVHRYRTVTRMWDDDAFDASYSGVSSGAIVAAARAASPGSVLDVTGNAPFVDDRWTFSLNGTVPGFREGVGDALRERLSDERATSLEGDTDSVVLFALVLDEIDAGASPYGAVASVARTAYERAGGRGRLNLLLTDGRDVVATAIGNSLFVRSAREAVLVASEPLDDGPGWCEVPHGSVVRASAHDQRIAPIEGLAS
jgi:glutamine amidotransferase